MSISILRSSLAFAASSILLLAPLCGCDAPSASAPQEGPCSIAIQVERDGARSSVSARLASPERGGRIVLHLWNNLLAISRTDSFSWDGGSSIEHLFSALPAGDGYRIAALYRTQQGLTTHRDTTAAIALGRGEAVRVSLLLRAVLARVHLALPAVPSQADTVSISFASPGVSRTARAARGTAGRTALGLDSLPVGAAGTLRLRAWNRSLDTLFVLDTVVSFSDREDQNLALVLQSALASSSASVGFAPGGQAEAVGGFAGESDQPGTQSGRLVITAIGDSGASDWIRITNPGEAPFVGGVRLGKGSGDAQFALDLPARSSIVVTRATSGLVAHPSHPFSAADVIADQPLIVVTHSGDGALWKLRNADGSEVLDAVFVRPGEGFWPVANTGALRTLRLRADRTSATQNDYGSNWCSDGSDRPDGSC